MSYDVTLANRIREIIASRENQVEEKLMFGGICFMVNDKMCVTTREDRIMARIAPDQYEIEILTDGCSPMIARGREMKGFIFVSGEALREIGQLERWVNMALEYNHIVAAEEKAKPKPAPKKAAAPIEKAAPKTIEAKPKIAAPKKAAAKKAAPRKAVKKAVRPAKKAAPKSKKKAAPKKAAKKIAKKSVKKVLRKKAVKKAVKKATKKVAKKATKKAVKKAAPKKRARR